MKLRPTCFTIVYCSLVKYVYEPSQNMSVCYHTNVYKYLFDA
jgi:hypothetical protein